MRPSNPLLFRQRFAPFVSGARQRASALLMAAACLLPALAVAQATDPAHVELPPSGSGPLLVLFAGADADRLFEGKDKNLPIPDLAGLAG